MSNLVGCSVQFLMPFLCQLFNWTLEHGIVLLMFKYAYIMPYRAHHSTETALLKVLSVTLLVQLLWCLQTSYSLDGSVLDCFRSYPSGPVQHIHSTKSKLLYGLSQGSVLGPTLFLLYTAKHPEADQASPLHSTRTCRQHSDLRVLAAFSGWRPHTEHFCLCWWCVSMDEGQLAAAESLISISIRLWFSRDPFALVEPQYGTADVICPRPLNLYWFWCHHEDSCH